MNGVLVDTSFLITLSQPDRSNHAVAKDYYMAFIKRGVPMYLSTIVISEYEVRQRIGDLGLSNFIVVPFNIDHGIAAGSLADAAFQERVEGYLRTSVKDDVKLLAQCELGGISHFITDDDRCGATIERLRKRFVGRAIPFGVLCSESFTETWFNDQNQMGLLPD